VGQEGHFPTRGPGCPALAERLQVYDVPLRGSRQGCVAVSSEEAGEQSGLGRCGARKTPLGALMLGTSPPAGDRSGSGVGGIVLVAPGVGLHVLRRHEPHLVAELSQLARPIMRAGRGLQSKKGARLLTAEQGTRLESRIYRVVAGSFGSGACTRQQGRAGFRAWRPSRAKRTIASLPVRRQRGCYLINCPTRSIIAFGVA
jgi:hypothetical protein